MLVMLGVMVVGTHNIRLNTHIYISPCGVCLSTATLPWAVEPVSRVQACAVAVQLDGCCLKWRVECCIVSNMEYGVSM